jgi:septum site-determining protein MinC
VQASSTIQAPSVLKPAKVVSRPVRSGQQIYAQGSDLVVTASVSEGAELLADGNIHVYGTLRGRALAGVKGNSNARVFCQSLDAELVSIAGQFIMHESVKGDCWKKPAQIFLEEETLRIAPLS